MIGLNQEEKEYYKRHLVLNEIGHIGQEKLKNAKVLCVGAGGLGSALLHYLAAAGIGTLGVIDGDQVEISNLHRQILFTTHDIGKNKAIIAKNKLQSLNPHIHINAYQEKLTIKNAQAILSQYDLIADGSDNFATRYLINHTCIALHKVNVSASISEFKGHCTVIKPFDGPCYHCLFPVNQHAAQLLNCAENGVLGVLPGIVGSLQANEVIKWLLGIGQPLLGKLLQIDALTLNFTMFNYDKNPDCELCSKALPEFFYPNAIVCRNSQKTAACAEKNGVCPRFF